MSITSMSARAGLAQKLSIPQLQQAIQDGTIPAYVGVPLLQDKVKAQKEAMAMSAQSRMPTIAEQVMNEATQTERGVPALPTNLPVAGMAGGGIVAFADGGMYDEEDDTDEDRMDTAREHDLDAAMQEAIDAREELGLMPEHGSADSYQAVRSTPSGDQFEAIALEKNKQHGVDERLLKHVMHKETGGLKDRAHAVSHAGAQGVMQLMPATAKHLGVKDAFDPEQNIEGGVKYLAQLERKYKDPKLAAMAYNWGPGNVDKWLMAGADMSKLPKETHGYVQGLAQGGEVQHYDNGGYTFDPNTGDVVEDTGPGEGLGAKLLRAINYNKGLTAGEKMPGMSKAKEQVAAALAARNNQEQAAANPSPMSAADEKMFSDATNRYMADRAAQQAAPAPAPDQGPAPVPAPQAAAATPAPAVDEFADIRDLLKQRYANMDKQREQDKAMAIIQAGLGMMGGTSQHALANIGQGAAQGIQSLNQANAARTAEENALLSGQLGLAKIGSARDQALAAQQLRKDIFGAQNSTKSERLALSEREELDKAIANRYSALSKNAKIAAESIFDPVKKKAFLDDMETKINQDKLYRDLYKQRWKTYPDEGLGDTSSKGDNKGWSITPTNKK
jgi:hypothetical protein